MNPDGGNAYPMHSLRNADTQPGMTLRDYFAAAALTGILSRTADVNYRLNYDKAAAVQAYELADVMIKQKEKRDATNSQRG